MSSQTRPLLPLQAPRAPAEEVGLDTTHDYSKVTYRGFTGTLTIAPQGFSYQSATKTGSGRGDDDPAPAVDDPSCTLSCPWTRVVQRHVSGPPPRNTPTAAAAPARLWLKLVLKSGRTALFGLSDLHSLVRLVQDVKARMEAHASRSITANDQPGLNSKNTSVDTAATAPTVDEDSPQSRNRGDDDVDDDDDDDRYQDEHDMDRGEEKDLNNDDDEDDDYSWSKCCWDDLWFILCIVMTFLVIVLVIGIVYLTVLRDDPTNDTQSLPPCVDEQTNTIVSCPPDYGNEERYGIRAVEYLWSPAAVTLQYYLSDYILDASVRYTVWDNSRCRRAAAVEGNEDDDSQKTGQALVPANNNTSWLQVDLTSQAAVDGGSNLFNGGRGTRQMDVTIGLLPDVSAADLKRAPFYTPRGVTGEKGWLRICVDFSITYNQVDGFDRQIEVNYIETAVQMNVDSSRPTEYENVQVRTVTTPKYT